MTVNLKIQKLRSYPDKLSIKKEILISCCAILLGIAMGFIAKMTDSISIVGEIGTEIGIWVFAATMIAAYSRYPLLAAINVFLFFVSMLFSYYLYGYAVLHFFPKSYFMGWLIITLVSPVGGFLMWFSKAKGSVGSIVAALPVAVLFAHGYPAFYTLRLSLFLSLVMGGVLCVILPKTAKSKIIAFCTALLLAFIIDKVYLFRFLPF